jgi:deoxyribodipyrimidine photolyase
MQLSKTFWRRLVWRDLAYWQLYHWPDMASAPIRKHYASMEWTEDPNTLRAWQRGQTGFPLVDAGMRELWATGVYCRSKGLPAAALATLWPAPPARHVPSRVAAPAG